MDDRENIELIKEKIDIVSYIGKYVKLKQAGKNFVGLCPFHQEKTPSFSVNADLGIFKCFGCGKGGDIFTFTQEIEKVDFPEALEKLAKEAGVTIVKNTRNTRNPLEEINELAKRYFQKELYAKENLEALKYIHGRGIDDKMIEMFGIGYASGDGKMFASFKKYKKYTDKQLIDSGLFLYKERIIKEKFKKRVMFPIFNTSNKVIAYTGRILPNNDFGPKYLNSPETEIYQKRNTVYALNFSKSNIRKEDLCIVVEGTTHVIATFQAGFPFAVAPLGTGLTIHQLELISKYTKNILFIFDNDNAGKKALEKAFSMSSQLNLNAYANDTEKYNDIDEMYRHEPKNISNLIKNKTDCFSYLVASKMADFDSSSLASFTQLKNYVFSLLSEVKDETLRSFYLEKAANITEIDFKDNAPTKKYTMKVSFSPVHLTLEDMYIQSLLSTFPISIPKSHNTEIFSQDNTVRILNALKGKGFDSAKDILELFSKEKEIYDYVEKLLMTDEDEIEIEDIYGRLEKSYLERKLRKLRTEVAISEQKGDTSGVEKTLKEILEIADKIKKYK
ncbi:DNA primase [Candidatus Dojkabacteria bacterium]|jgi:DNA primase|nr:DNA primase [Candidatus Dojkabacteria bacterium]